MRHFFFHLDYLLDTVKDLEGSECASLEAAKVEARAILRKLVAEHLTTDRLFEPIGMSIYNQAGKILARVSVAEAINEVLPVDRLMPPTAS